MEKTILLLGAHVSILGGFEKALERGEESGCSAIQVFTKSNRQWISKPIEKADALLFKKAQETSNILCVIAHASYLINIGSPDNQIREKSIAALLDELERCETLGIPFLVFHPGSYTHGSKEDCLKKIAQSINIILEQYSGKTCLILETSAGQGSSVGNTLEELASIKKLIKNQKKIGFCVDTCHIFAAGYDIRTIATYNLFWENFDKLLGIENLKVIHLNDSKKELNSNVDRHENIGSGALGVEAFRFIMNDKRLLSIPKIVETPKNSPFDDIENLSLLKKLIM